MSSRAERRERAGGEREGSTSTWVVREVTPAEREKERRLEERERREVGVKEDLLGKCRRGGVRESGRAGGEERRDARLKSLLHGFVEISRFYDPTRVGRTWDGRA